MQRFFSYVMPRDFGFAPNPFHGFCTLATCKPLIRDVAQIGDWVFGTSSTKGGTRPKLIYAMCVSAVISFDEYFNSDKYSCKKPIMNGSLQKMYGDNIYHSNNSEGNDRVWIQSDSHHSGSNGEQNLLNLKKDTSSERVLIADIFYYFGEKAILIPEKFVEEFCKKGPGHRYVDEKTAKKMIKHLTRGREPGIIGFPEKFEQDFKRYKGEG